MTPVENAVLTANLAVEAAEAFREAMQEQAAAWRILANKANPSFRDIVRVGSESRHGLDATGRASLAAQAAWKAAVAAQEYLATKPQEKA